MSFKENFYGSKNPKLRTVVTINLFVSTLTLTLYAFIFGKLVANESLWRFLNICSLFVGITSAVAFAYVILFNTNQRETLRKQLEMSHKYCKYKIIRLFWYIFLIPFSGVLFGGFLWGSIYGACDIYTKIFGEKYEGLELLHKVHKRHRKGCDYYFSGVFFEKLPMKHYCLDYEVFVALPEGNFEVNLYGKKSIFGVVVTEWKITNS